MAVNYKTLADFEVATAEEAQSYFMDQAIIKVDADTDLALLPNEVKTAYILNTGVLMARNVANVWVPMGGVATVDEVAPANPQKGSLWIKPSEVLPKPVRAAFYGANNNFGGAVGTWQDIGSQTPQSITLPKPAMVQVNWSTWMQNPSGGGDFQARIAWTGAATGNSYDHMGGWYGAVMCGSGDNIQRAFSNGFSIALPAGTTTFKMQARRASNAVTTTLHYPGIGITPVAWADQYEAGVS